MSKLGLIVVIFWCACGAWIPPSLAAPATSRPTTQADVLDVKDKDALTAHKDQDVTLEGTIDSAKWSKTGKVMNINFKDGDAVMCVVFVKNREDMDKAFGGNAADKWTGAKVHITGKLVEYGGKLKTLKGKLQVIIEKPDQVTILDASPTTTPAQ